MSTLRIAMLSTCAWRTPPKWYGPMEKIASLLAEGLTARGIDVTLFATKDSITSAKLQAVCPVGYEEDTTLDRAVWPTLHIAQVFEQADQFDVIHNHFDVVPLSYTQLVKTPVVTTIHGYNSPQRILMYKKYNKKTHYVSISNSFRHPDLDYIATVYHGIDLGNFTLRTEPGEYLLFFARIHQEKGTKEAIEIAHRAGKKLVVAGIIADQKYFEEHVQPHLNNSAVKYVGNVGPEERNKLLGGALALLHPINFEEPFGLGPAEAMACGTPVIAFKRGSMPEVIVEGKTGFLVQSIDEAVQAVNKLDTIKRIDCRRHVENTFTVERMVEGYLDVYEQLAAR